MKFELGMVYRALGTCSACPLSSLKDSTLHCGKDGKEVRLFDSTYSCPDGKWVSEINIQANTIRGVGDLVKKATDFLGIQPCSGCKDRQEWLNKYLPLGGSK